MPGYSRGSRFAVGDLRNRKPCFVMRAVNPYAFRPEPVASTGSVMREEPGSSLFFKPFKQHPFLLRASADRLLYFFKQMPDFATFHQVDMDFFQCRFLDRLHHLFPGSVFFDHSPVSGLVQHPERILQLRMAFGETENQSIINVKSAVKKLHHTANIILLVYLLRQRDPVTLLHPDLFRFPPKCIP